MAEQDISLKSKESNNLMPDLSHFDFWVGKWEVKSNGQIVGINVIEKLHNGCVIVENWSGTSGATGISISFFNPIINKWQQNYVANDLTIWELYGEYKDGAMRFEGVVITSDGKIKKTRVIFYNLGTDRLQHTEDNSTDDGETWENVWDAVYHRK